jgi:hypothetical protein
VGRRTRGGPPRRRAVCVTAVSGHTGPMVAIVLIVIVLVLLGTAYGLYSRRGSEITEHPRGEDRR